MRATFLLAVIAVAAFSGGALADTRSDVLQRLAQCNSIPDGRNWLECYYAAAQPERTELGLPAAPQAPAFEPLFARPAAPAAISRAAPVEAETSDGGGGFLGLFGNYKVPVEQFGLTNARPGSGPNVDRVVEKLSSYTFANGMFTATLANGQVWQQTGGPHVIWRSTPASYTATITRGALRTFNLRVQNGPNADDTMYKVERIH